MRKSAMAHPLVLVVTAALVLGMALNGCSSRKGSAPPQFAGRQACASCHEKEHRLWTGSDHALAMQEATDNTVLGDFDNATFRYYGITSTFFRKNGKFYVRTDGSDGTLQDFEIAYAFGVRPLQQYLVRFPRGRFQALTICWDARPKAEGGQRWFHLYPDEFIRHDDILHWTKPSETWNFMCAECHSTGLRKNYDLAKDAYATTWFEIDVSCEECHGPGSNHLAWARERNRGGTGDPSKGLAAILSDPAKGSWVLDPGARTARRTTPLSSQAQTDTCFRCHARRIPIQDPWVSGTPFLEAHMPLVLTRELYHPDGQILDEVYEYGSFVQSRMYRAGVRCSDCHDSHSLILRASGNGVCTPCHRAELYDASSHHHHRTGTKGSSCVECHMMSKNYMVVDPRRDHGFRVPRPDLAAKLGTPDPCTRCHRGKGAAWAAKAVEVWRGPGRPPPPHFGETIQAGRLGKPGAGDALMALALDNTHAGIVRATALTLLRNVARPAHLERLKAALSDPDPLVRAKALGAMDGFRPETRWQFANPLLKDPVRLVRFEAARTLAPVPNSLLSPEQISVLDSAVDDYIRAQRVNEDMSPFHINIGVAHQQRGRPDKAEAAYRDAIRLDPTFAPAYVNLADLYRERKRDDEGEKVLREGLSVSPKAAELHHALGLLLVRQKRLPEALPHLSEAAALRPDLARYALAQALAQDAAGQGSRALGTLQHAYRRHPYDPDLLFALATFLRDRGNPADALRLARELAAVSPEDPGARRLLQEMESRNR
ncbi:MAG TPA: tetratricopeptide repeat protein [Candidatus Deferrimicrobiaceae bacterium]